MSERPLFPNGALARNNAVFRDSSGANAFRDPPTSPALTDTVTARGRNSGNGGESASYAIEAEIAAEPGENEPGANEPGANESSGVGAGANKPRVKENIFASPQAGSVRAYQAGDFMATESDSAEMLLLAGQLAAGLSGFGVLILVAVLFKIIVWPFTLFACGVFLVSVGMAVTVLIRGWQEASLRRIGVMRPTSGRSTTAATVYSVSAVVVALGGLAAATFSWFN
jgi:hypothetical protein